VCERKRESGWVGGWVGVIVCVCNCMCLYTGKEFTLNLHATVCCGVLQCVAVRCSVFLNCICIQARNSLSAYGGRFS